MPRASRCPLPKHVRGWVRWFLRRDLSPDACAFALALEPADVAAFVEWDRDPRRPGFRARPARPKPDGRPGIRGDTAARVRRLRTLGHDAEVISDLMGIDQADVADYLVRIAPRGHAAGDELARPRTRREQQGRRPRRIRPYRPRPVGVDEWGPRLEPTDLVHPAALEAHTAGDVPELVELPRAEVLTDQAEVAEDWGSLQDRRARGSRATAAKLSDDQAERARAMRERGIPRADVARELGVSVATITRITRGETYRPAEVLTGPAGPELPTIAAAEVPATGQAGPLEPAADGDDWGPGFYSRGGGRPRRRPPGVPSPADPVADRQSD